MLPWRRKSKSYSVAQPTVGRRERRAVARVVRSGWLTQSKTVERFEHEFGKLLGVEGTRVVACNSGTSALTVALLQQMPRRGTRVVMPSLTYAGTLNAVFAAGLRPMLTDVQEETWCMGMSDVAAAHERAAQEATENLTFEGPTPNDIAGYLPVHLYGYLSGVTSGRCKPVERYSEFSGRVEKVYLPVVEDACEALGARDTWGVSGTRGTASVFSFFANKQVTTMGEGGVVVAKTREHAEEMRVVRGQGQHANFRYEHVRVGMNARMLEAQAAFGLAQLSRWEHEDQLRRVLLCEYRRAFSEWSGVVQMRSLRAVVGLHGAPWLCAARVPFDVRATGFLQRLAERGVEARPMFAPLHSFSYLTNELAGQARYWDHTMFRHSEKIARTAFALPLHASLRRADVREIAKRVIETAREVLGHFERTVAILPFDEQTTREIAESQVKWHTR